MEGILSVTIINNTLGIVFTFALGSWLDAQSVTDVVCEIGALSCVFIMTALPMMIWDKSFRKWTLGRNKEFIITRNQML